MDVVVLLDASFAPGPPVENRARAAAVAREFGIEPAHVYGAAVFGFAGTVPRERFGALNRDPRVAAVEEDRIDAIDVQEIPTGIDRVEADRSPAASIDGGGATIDLDVAVLDTGIDPGHPDLRVAGGRNFDSGPPHRWADGNGHGTHVAGTIGALDDGVGVVGVAPGVRLWALRVCNNGGLCSTSGRVAAIDWIVERKADYHDGRSGGIDFVAANMSIGFPEDPAVCSGDSGVLHQAVCRLIDAGVLLSMSAGNEAREKQAWPEPVVVTAIADFDGRAGGAGVSTCRTDGDDTLADFSNWGSTMDIAAPGTCILSTWPGGSYAILSGTSMAAPHVAGAVALYVHATGGVPAIDRSGSDAIRQVILGAALPQSDPCSYTNERAGQGSDEPLLFVNGAAFGGNGSCEVDVPPEDAPPTVTITSPGDATTVDGDVVVRADAADDHGVERVEFRVDGETIGIDGDRSDGWSALWMTIGYANGPHVVRAIAVDARLQTGEDDVTVTIDNTSGPASKVHIGDLVPIKVSLNKGEWRAQVDVTVHDGEHRPIDGVTVEATWDAGDTGGADACTTLALWNGRCALSSDRVKNRVQSVTFVITEASHPSLDYDPSLNHDPDGDSDGRTVVVTK